MSCMTHRTQVDSEDYVSFPSEQKKKGPTLGRTATYATKQTLDDDKTYDEHATI